MKTISICRGYTASYDEAEAVLVLELEVDRLIDISLIADIENEIKLMVSDLEPRVVVLGFDNVSVFSSEVVSVVHDLQRTMLHLNGALKLTGLKPVVEGIFHQLNLDEDVLQIHDTTSDALAELKQETQASA